MKANNITIDINKLTVEELEMIAKINYEYNKNDVETAKKIQDRIYFLYGWMTDKQEAEYIEKYC